MPNNDKSITRGCVLLRRWMAEDTTRRQVSLAEDLDVTQAAVSNIVTGRSAPSMALAVLIHARTRGAVRVTDWLDPVAAARVERMSRLVGLSRAEE